MSDRPPFELQIFAENVRGARQALDLSLRELATKANVSRARLADIETGCNVTLTTALRVARALQTTVGALLKK